MPSEEYTKVGTYALIGSLVIMVFVLLVVAIKSDAIDNFMQRFGHNEKIPKENPISNKLDIAPPEIKDYEIKDET